jgi:hypothetical protein
MSMSMSILAIVAAVRVGASVGSDRRGRVASLVGNVVGAARLRPFSLRWAEGTRSRARRCSERREVRAGLSEGDGDEGTRRELEKDRDWDKTIVVKHRSGQRRPGSRPVLPWDLGWRYGRYARQSKDHLTTCFPQGSVLHGKLLASWDKTRWCGANHSGCCWRCSIADLWQRGAMGVKQGSAAMGWKSKFSLVRWQR